MHDNEAPTTAKIKTSLCVRVLIFLAIVLAALSIAGSGYLWLQFKRVNQAQTQQALHLQTVANHIAQTTQQQLQTQLASYRQQFQKDLQRQQQSLLATQATLNHLLQISGKNNEQWTLTEAQYLIHLANLNLSLGHNLTSCIRLLKLADQRLSSLNDLSLNNVRAALSNNIATLSAIPKVDVVGIIMRLNTLDQQITQLPILAPYPAPGNALPATANNSKAQSHWQATLNKLKSLFVIRHLKQPITPLLPPSQLSFLKENISLKISQAQWAVLHQNQLIYLENLAMIKRWVNQYFNKNLTQLFSINQQLTTLQTRNVNPKMPAVLSSLTTIEKMLKINAQKTFNKQPTSNLTPKQQSVEPQNKKTPSKSIKPPVSTPTPPASVEI